MVENLPAPQPLSKWENFPDSDDETLEGEIIESEASDTPYNPKSHSEPHLTEQRN